MLTQEKILIMEKPRFRTKLKELMDEHPDVTRMDIVRKAFVSYDTVVSWEEKALQTMNSKVLHLLDIFGKTSLDEILYVVDEEEE